MKLNNLTKTNYPKLRVGRGIGSGKGKTSGRGVKGQKSRSGVAIKSFEGGQMPLYRRLPDLELLLKNKKIKPQDEINFKNLSEKNLIGKRFNKLKILGKGEIKEKLKISPDFISKSAKAKIEKVGGKINISKEKTQQNG